ncbi:MAG: PEP-CTERM sorting domain-containing protein [Pirellulales bacterium]|nr:PEP-CTERM sorting domain-containing protein [Pirellulales bacterium]
MNLPACGGMVVAAAKIWAAAVPEPSSIVLASLGLAVAFGAALRRRKRNVRRRAYSTRLSVPKSAR